MSNRRMLWIGALTALFSLYVVAGSLLLAVSEDPSLLAQLHIPTRLTTQTTPSAPLATGVLLTPLPSAPVTNPNPTPSSQPIVQVNCPPPSGWTAIIVVSGETLEDLARRYNTSPQMLIQGNCLQVNDLLPGTTLMVPPHLTQPSAVPTATPCPGPPFGWVVYIVQPGDTLFRIALNYGLTLAELQRSNCIWGSFIMPGQRLYVPNIPIPTWTAAWTATPSPTIQPSHTAIPTSVPASATPTFVVPPTETPSPTPTETPPPPTETPSPTSTETAPPPSETPTPTSTPELAPNTAQP